MEGGHLLLAKRNHSLNDEQHLAEMISIVGPPPPEFLKRSKRCLQFWDEKGMMLISYDWVILTFLHLYRRQLERLYTYTRTVNKNEGTTICRGR